MIQVNYTWMIDSCTNINSLVLNIIYQKVQRQSRIKLLLFDKKEYKDFPLYFLVHIANMDASHDKAQS